MGSYYYTRNEIIKKTNKAMIVIKALQQLLVDAPEENENLLELLIIQKSELLRFCPGARFAWFEGVPVLDRLSFKEKIYSAEGNV